MSAITKPLGRGTNASPGSTQTFSTAGSKPTLPPLRPGRVIEGISAVLLPFKANGLIDLSQFEELVERTWSAGLTPAVNMDTGYTHLLEESKRNEILDLVRRNARGRKFVVGAFIEGLDGNTSELYRERCLRIANAGGTPILFPCSATRSLGREAYCQVYRDIAQECPQFLGFELGEMFVSFGRIWDLETFRALIEIPELAGIKHSSLSRQLEWDRLRIRDEVRPDFRIYTGNDLAIDLVQWGSDYLLGLSAFHPEAFALRDHYWSVGDPRFFELNDWLQYLGMFAFRAPVPAYRHSCAQFLHLRGRISSSEPHPNSPRRPESDVPVLRQIAERLDEWVALGRA